MHHLHKLKTLSLLKWGSSNFLNTHLRLSFSLGFIDVHMLKTPSFCSHYSTRPKKDQSLEEIGTPTPTPTPTPTCVKVSKGTRTTQIEKKRQSAQSALLDYLHSTRSYPFPDAEHISKNCPVYVNKLLKNVKGEEEVVPTLTKYFHYHPINEFEPFLESIGVSSSEIDLVLPRDLMYLKDDALLLENYNVLINYGVERGVVGKLYKGAVGAFKYGHGVLRSKLRCCEDLGLSETGVVKVIESCPYLLIGDVNEDFVKILDLLKSAGVELKYIEGCLSEQSLHDWSRAFELLSFIFRMGCSKEELENMMKNGPGLVFSGSGRIAFQLFGLLLKYGASGKEISSLLLQFPQLQGETFVKNLRQSIAFLVEIEMDNQEIAKIVREHAHVLGSCSLKKCSSILCLLNVGKSRVCHILKEDPSQLKKWALGLKVEPLSNSGEDEKSQMQKKNFFLHLGFPEKSKGLEKALKKCKGKGGDLQGRFDCFLKAGLDRKDVIAIIKESPQVLNQTKDVLNQKIDFLVNGLGYPISSLVAFPNYINHTIGKVKLRYAMYSWLKDKGKVSPTLALSTILACSEKIFVATYVQRHPRGLEVWESLKKENSV